MNHAKNMPASSDNPKCKQATRTNPYNLFLILILLLNSSFVSSILGKRKKNDTVKEFGREKE
jgi:hypothetical protein